MSQTSSYRGGAETQRKTRRKMERHKLNDSPTPTPIPSPLLPPRLRVERCCRVDPASFGDFRMSREFIDRGGAEPRNKNAENEKALSIAAVLLSFSPRLPPRLRASAMSLSHETTHPDSRRRREAPPRSGTAIGLRRTDVDSAAPLKRDSNWWTAPTWSSDLRLPTWMAGTARADPGARTPRCR